MMNTLKVYDIELITRGPVFVGNGNELKKNEYFNIGRRKVVIPRLDLMYKDLVRMNRQRSYENYMLRNNRLGLGQWLREERISDDYIQKWKKYELDCGDVISERGKQLQIMTCIKDPYGNPYIPGSSLKGMLRTILLAYDIRKNQDKYSSLKDEIERTVRTEQHPKRMQFLSRQGKSVETAAFNTLHRPDTKSSDAVNDFMSGLIVSDSDPLTIDDLTLCQKIEHHVDGEDKNLNLLRECIKPGVRIHFTMTIDTSLCKLDDKNIMSAISDFAEVYYDMFLCKYKESDKPDDNTVWLGGGAGFVSKTVIYSLFGDDGIKLVPEIFAKTGVPQNHKHNKDKSLGVSPHILKLTSYRGKMYEFGKCSVKITKKM